MARKSAPSTSSKTKVKAHPKSTAPKPSKSTPLQSGSGTESDEDDVPETFTLDQSKRHAKDERRKMEEWRAEEKERKRERQRQRSNAQVAAEGGDEESRAIARMERAMQDAQNSDDDDEDGLPLDGDDLDADAGGLDSEDDILDDEDDLEDDDDDEESMDDDDVEDGEWGGVSIDATDEYLPDHLFESAFAAQHAANISAKKQQKKQLLSGSSKATTPSTRKKQTRNTAKDIQLGTNTFRVLPASASPHTIPASLKARKFYEKTLGLKSGGQAVRGRGWERRAANVGVLRRSVHGPASGFARQTR